MTSRTTNLENGQQRTNEEVARVVRQETRETQAERQNSVYFQTSRAGAGDHHSQPQTSRCGDGVSLGLEERGEYFLKRVRPRKRCEYVKKP